MQNIVEKIAVSVTKEVLARKVLDDILRIVVKFRHDIFMMINSKDWEEDATESMLSITCSSNVQLHNLHFVVL